EGSVLKARALHAARRNIAHRLFVSPSCLVSDLFQERRRDTNRSTKVKRPSRAECGFGRVSFEAIFNDACELPVGASSAGSLRRWPGSAAVRVCAPRL